MDFDDSMTVEWLAIDAVHLSPSNPRHNDHAVPHVAASLQRFGWRQPIVARPDGEVIAGNTRLKAAQSLGMKMVPVVWFEGPAIEATAFAIADNRTHEFADWDEPALASLLKELQAEDALFGVGFDEKDIEELLAGVDGPVTGLVEDPGPIEPPQIAVSKPGDIWLLGEHRLMCGDSTKAEDVGRLMAGQTAALLATDPPYLVDYDGTNHPAEHHKKAGRAAPAKAGSTLGNKHWDAYVDPAASVAFFRSFLEVGLVHCREDVPIYQWHATRRQVLVEAAWAELDLLVHQTIIWTKSRGVMTRSHFLWKHEPCFYGWRRGKQPSKERRPPPAETTIWEIGQAGEQDGIHPTQKPRDIFRRPIGWHTRPGELVYEPFSGSGTQIIAAEELGRRCFAMELSPGFVDAAVLRWQKATGKDAILEKSGESYAQAAAGGVD